jgi:hypothetical protein
LVNAIGSYNLVVSTPLKNSSIQIQIGVHDLREREVWSLAKQSRWRIGKLELGKDESSRPKDRGLRRKMNRT